MSNNIFSPMYDAFALVSQKAGFQVVDYSDRVVVWAKGDETIKIQFDGPIGYSSFKMI